MNNGQGKTMRRSFGTVAVIGSLLSVLCVSLAWSEDWKPKVDALVNPAVESGIVTGLAVGVVFGEKTQTFGYGKASAASQAVPDETTLFEIGSVTKVFTAIALADMAREKLVSIDDPVGKWLPESVKVANRDGKEITLAHLSTHASGLPRLGRTLELQALRNPLNPYAQFTTDELYATLASARLATTPGAKYAYSNLGVGLLGHMLARRAGLSYEELIQRRITVPLGMTDTRIALPDALKSRLAEGHDIDGNPLPPWDIITLAGCGGLRSNVRDLVRFVQANLGLLKSPLAEAMQTAHKPRLDIGPNEAICLGWHLRKAEGILWHNGQTGGYHSFVGLRKNPPMGVVVLGNSAGGTVDGIGYRLLDLLAGKEPKPLPIRPPVRVDPAVLEQYVGNYELYPNFILSVTRTDDRLWVQATNQPRLGVYPESETKFSYRAVDAKITFVRNKEGKVDKMVLHQHGLDMPAWKGGLIVHFGGQLLKGLKGVGGPSTKAAEPKAKP
jgi:CubicO group peptidase (beta-lactamase class C family)